MFDLILTNNCHFLLQKLAEQLGMESVEELEQALDAMAGIDTDGGEIDTSDVREARVRSAYLDWCKEYGNTADESRFPIFSSNFLAMEEYAQENGREMVLNKYADCTEEEYRQLTNAAAPVPEPAAPETIVQPVAEVEVEVEVTKAPATSIESVDYDAAARLAYEAAGSEGSFEAFKAKYLEEASAMVAGKGMMTTVPPPAPKKEVKEAASKEEVKAAAPKKEAPKKAAPPKAKTSPKPVPKPEPVVPVLSLEEEAIKLAREVGEKEAAQVAARRMRDEAAAELELMKAKEALEKQQQLAATRPAQVPPPPKFQVTNDALVNRKPRSSKPAAETQNAPVVSEPVQAEPVKKAEPVKAGNIFASFLGGATSTPKPVENKVKKVEPPKVAAPKVEPPKVEPPKNFESKASPFDFFQQPATKSKPVEKKEPVAPVAKKEPVAPVVKKKEASPFTFFQQPAQVKPKAAPVQPKAAPVQPKADAKKEDIVMAPNAMTEALNSFFGSKPSTPAAMAPPAPVPAPVPAPAKTKKPKQASFSFFGGSSTPASPKAPVTPKASTPVPAKKVAPKKLVPKTPPAPTANSPAPNGSGTFSLFGGAAIKTKKAVVETPKPTPVPKESSTPAFGGFFSASAPKAAPKAPPAEPSTPAPAPRGSGTFSLFGGSAPAKPSAPVASTPAKTPVVKKSPPKKAAGVGGIGMFAQKKAPAKPQGTQAIGKSGPGTISIAKTSPPPKKAAQKSPTFSLFGSQPPKKAEPAAPAAPTPVKKSGGFSFGAPKKVAPKAESAPPAKPAQKSPTFSLFGSSPKQAAPAAAVTQAVKPKPAPKSSGFSLGGAKKPAVASDVPVVSNFKQNADGSISGSVSNSKNFRNGTKITTSPVKKGAKAGEIVTTSSGSKYRLQ